MLEPIVGLAVPITITVVLIQVYFYIKKKQSEKLIEEYNFVLIEDQQNLKIVFIKIEKNDFLKKTGEFRLTVDCNGKGIYYYFNDELIDKFAVLDNFVGSMVDLKKIFPKEYMAMFRQIYINA